MTPAAAVCAQTRATMPRRAADDADMRKTTERREQLWRSSA